MSPCLILFDSVWKYPILFLSFATCLFTNIFGRETFVNTFMLQIAVLSNHLHGRDTHVRQIKVYGPRPWAFFFFSCTLFCLSVSDAQYSNWNGVLKCYISGTLFRISLFNLLQESSLHTLLWDEKCDLAQGVKKCGTLSHTEAWSMQLKVARPSNGPCGVSSCHLIKFLYLHLPKKENTFIETMLLIGSLWWKISNVRLFCG